jgi:hypothetical protein
MPKIHVYVRTQVTAPDVSGIEEAVKSLREAIEAVDGDTRGFSATVEPDALTAEEAAVPRTETNVLDGTVADVTEAVSAMSDVHALQRLRVRETDGKDRSGALDAIDARIAALKG